MRPQNPNNIANWKFSMEDPAGEILTLPPSGNGANSLSEVLSQVLSYCNAYDAETKNEYTKEQRKLALKAGLTFDSYMAKLIEHQMCLTNKGIKCWSDGIGDDIHNVLTGVDSIVNLAPGPIANLARAAISKITPSGTRTFGGCSACGGSRVMKPNSDNLGRAGRMNRR